MCLRSGPSLGALLVSMLPSKWLSWGVPKYGPGLPCRCVMMSFTCHPAALVQSWRCCDMLTRDAADGTLAGTGVMWKGFETYSQISFRNIALVSSDWLRTKIFGRDISKV